MVEKKNQHYVPQFYFRFFSHNGKDICIFNLNNKKHFVGPFKNQSSKDYFYHKGKELEEEFEKIENSQREALIKLIRGLSFKDLSKEEYIELLRFITFQSTRTNYSKRSVNQTTEYFVSEFIKPLMLQDKDLVSKVGKETIKDIPITFPADHLINISVGIQSPILISDLIPVLLINKTDFEFIFSDNPIILYNLYFCKDTFESHIGFQSPGLQIYCPLSKNLCLLLFDPKTYQINGLKNNTLEIGDAEDIKKINELQFHRCDEQIYYSSQIQENNVNNLSLEFFKNHIKKGELVNLRKLRVLNKPNSEVLMTGEKNINEEIKPSFLDIKNIGEDLERVRNQKLVDIFNSFFEKDKNTNPK